MTPPIENVSTWLVDWSLVTIIDNTLPPRDPNDDDNEDDEDDEDDDEENDEDETDDDLDDDELEEDEEEDDDDDGLVSGILERRAKPIADKGSIVSDKDGLGGDGGAGHWDII